jgi:hypothetical protein
MRVKLREHGSSVQALAEAEAKKLQLHGQLEDLSKRAEAQQEKLTVYERRAPGDSGGQEPEAHRIEAEVAQLR